MTERGAQTTEGQFARLRDSVEDLQRHLGRAIIEESGLNDAMRDGSRFADDMKRNVDELRPAIRFAADVTKGLAQVLGEGVRNGPLFARAFGEAVRETNPRIRQFVDLVDQAVNNLKAFQADPRLVARVAVDLAEGFTVAFGGLFEVMGDGLDEVFKRHVKPITDEIRSAADLWRMIRGAAGAVADPIREAGGAHFRAVNAERLAALDRGGRIEYADDALKSFHATTERLRGTMDVGPLHARIDQFNAAVKQLNEMRRLGDELGKAEGLAREASGFGPTSRFTADEARLMRAQRDRAKEVFDAAWEEMRKQLDALPKRIAAEQRKAAAQPTIFDRMRTKFDNLALRNIAARMDPQLGMMMLLGGAGGFDPSKLNRPIEEFKIDPAGALPAGGRGPAPFPTSLEWGSKAAAEAFAELVNAGGRENPVVAAVERSTEVQREMRAELDQIRGHLAVLSQPTSRQRLIY